MIPTPLVLGTIKVTPVSPFIDSAYYLIGDMNKWNGAALIQFKQSGKDVYEDPIFTIVVEVPENCYWKVVPQKNVDSGNIEAPGILGCAVDGDTSEEGKLITQNPKAMKIEDAGWVRITLNMMESTYEVEFLGNVSPYMYVPGNHQGWAPATAPILYSADFTNYSGFVSLNSAFKVVSQRDWDGTNYGNGGEGMLSTDKAAGDLTVAKEGFYFLTANVSLLTWNATLIETIGLIGTATDGGWDNSTAMQFDVANSQYTVTTTLKEGEFKFRANNAWDVSLGGDLNNLTTNNGANITVGAGKTVATGTYKITLLLGNAEQYKAILEKQ